jgi:hypothetical protein
MRAFVIANGKSLRSIPWSLLRNDITFAMNRIDLLYEPFIDVEDNFQWFGTNWRPTYYVFYENIPTQEEPIGDDQLSNQPESYVIPKHIQSQETCFISTRFLDRFASAMGLKKREALRIPNVVWMAEPTCHRTNYFCEDKPTEWHFPNFCNYGGTMNSALRIPFMMGFDPVYLIGADLGYQDPINGRDVNHFHPGYLTAEGFPLNELDATLTHLHSMVRETYEAHNRQIFNATMGGNLEAYERVSLESII